MGRIALIGENSIEYVSTLLAIWNAGCCGVLIDCQIPVQIAMDMMHEASVEKCYVDQKYYNKYPQADLIEFVPYKRVNFPLPCLLPKEVYDQFNENYSNDEAIIIYSSGTTGKSKGIILSHYAINTNADAIIDYMKPTVNSCIYIVRNLTHASTVTGELLVALKKKISLLIAPVIVPPRYVLNNIYKYHVSIIGLNPWLLSMYAQEYQTNNYDISTLERIYVSGSILDDKTYELAQRVFKEQEIFNVYGLSEVAPRVAAQRHDCCNGNSVGKPIKGVKVEIVNEKGKLVTSGTCGIIHVNSPSIFDGYICGELKHQSLYQGWLNTGDIGYFDECGELHVVGRTDDMIVISARKVYPSEVAKHIQAVANIQECVVTMVSMHDHDVLCCLYVADTKIRNELVSKLSTVLIKYEIPKVFVRIDELPRTQNGKIALQAVKRILLEEMERE